jgi:inositol 1,4,5-triphosphate receptor type 1
LEERHAKNPKLAADEHSKQQLATLKRVKDKELEMNNKNMQDKLGQDVNFGDIVQLLHLRSQKYLSISRTAVAQVESENFQVYLTKDLSSLCWFTLKPSEAFQSILDPLVGIIFIFDTNK